MGGNILFRMRCVDVGNSCWKLGETIEVDESNEAISIEPNGKKSGICIKIFSFKDWTNRTSSTGSKWELIKEEGETKMEDLRELIKPCYAVRFRGEGQGWCIAMNRNNGEIGFNSIYDLKRGIMRLSSLDKKLLDKSEMSEYDIMEIRGYADVDQTRIDNRPLIWKREEKSTTQLKLEELENKQREIADEMEKLRKEL